jgi:hypothetical protein
MRRLKNDCTGLVVAVSAQDVREFNRTWPCSNIPEIGIKFVFDHTGNLVDIIPEDWRDMRDSSKFDGPALLALSQDAQSFQPKMEAKS